MVMFSAWDFLHSACTVGRLSQVIRSLGARMSSYKTLFRATKLFLGLPLVAFGTRSQQERSLPTTCLPPPSLKLTEKKSYYELSHKFFQWSATELWQSCSLRARILCLLTNDHATKCRFIFFARLADFNFFSAQNFCMSLKYCMQP